MCESLVSIPSAKKERRKNEEVTEQSSNLFRVIQLSPWQNQKSNPGSQVPEFKNSAFTLCCLQTFWLCQSDLGATCLFNKERTDQGPRGFEKQKILCHDIIWWCISFCLFFHCFLLTILIFHLVIITFPPKINLSKMKWVDVGKKIYASKGMGGFQIGQVTTDLGKSMELWENHVQSG